MITSFIEKLDQLHLFLVEKNGDLILKSRKATLAREEVNSLIREHGIADFIRQNKQELVDYLAKAASGRRAIYKLSPLQEGMLFHHLYDDFSQAYTEQFTIDFTAGFHPERFKTCWNYILRNHSILRSSILHDQASIPLQCVHPEVHLPITELDFSAFEAAEQAAEIKAFLTRDLAKGFNFSEPPLMRISLLKTAPACYKMVWTYHHILLDGWSLPIIMEEFMVAYEALSNGQPLPEKAEDRYEDFIRYIDSKNAYEEEAFWKSYLQGLETPGLLPFAGNAANRNKGGASMQSTTLALDAQLSEQIKNYARLHHLTVNTLIQGVWALLSSRYSGHNDPVFGTTVSGRPVDLENAEQKAGLYINVLPLRCPLNGDDTIAGWLAKLQQGHVAAREYQYTALNTVQQWAGIHGDFFDSLVVFENYPVGDVLDQQEWTLKTGEIQVREETNYLLTIIAGLGETIKLTFNFKNELLEARQVEAIKAHFETAFRAFTDPKNVHLSDVSILTAPEKQQLLEGFNRLLDAPYPEAQTIVGLFEAQAANTPDRIAVVSGDNALTYRELNERANQLAHYLREKGARRESLIALCLDRSCDMIVSILAVLKAGGAYVPIDPDYPQERIAYLLQDTQAPLVLTSKMLRPLVGNHPGAVLVDEDAAAIAAQPVTNPAVSPGPDDLAYVIYTSGSTGLPKGVLIEHKNVVRLFKNEACLFDFNEQDVWTLFHSYSFDFSVWEIFGALFFGGKLVVVPSETRKDPIAFSRLLAEEGVTVLNQTPGAFYQLQEVFLPSFAACTLRYVIFGGEALNPSMLRQWKTAYPECRLINMYGITETTVHVTYKELLESDVQSASSNIGRPIPTLGCYVLDGFRNMAPVGTAGELYVGGTGVARGYLNRPELTEERFLFNPFTGNGRLYKTGDLVRWLPNGDMEYLGRIDNQVKIHGYRIELGEIESVLQACDRVKQGAVLAKEDATGHKRLYAYAVAEAGGFDKKGILDYLRARLPEYMVPSVLIEMSELPLTSNGKIDKKALPLPDSAELTATAYVAPRNEVETQLAQIWKEVLKIEKAGVQDNFFESGGHSLMAIRMVSAIRKALHQEVKVRDIFNYPTIEALAQTLTGAEAAQSLPALVAADRPARIPLSYSQERLWFIDQLQGSTAYHLPTVLRLTNKPDRNRLETALLALVQRHEILRTVIKTEEGQPYQEILPAEHWRMAYSEGEAFSNPAHLADFIAQETSRPFQLSKDYMLRAHLVHCAADDYVLILTVHHIASDGWSESILVQDLVACYRAAGKTGEAMPAPLSLQYADYAIWQRAHLSGEYLATELNWWKQQLQGIEPLMLPTDFPRPAIQSTRGANHHFLIEKDLLEKLKTLSMQSEATLFMTLLSAYYVLLHRYSNQEDICVGTPLANRNRQEVESLVGFFVNTLVVRSKLAGNPGFATLLNQVKATMLVTFAHQEVPFEQIVEAVETDRSLSRSPLFQVMFSLQNAPEAPALELENLHIAPISFEENNAQFDLTLSAIETPESLQLSLEYCTDLFDSATITRMAGHYRMLLEAIVANPKQSIANLPMLPESEVQRMLTEFNAPGAAAPDQLVTVTELFEKQAAQTPDKLAIAFNEQQLNYGMLNSRANQLARLLQEKGVQEGSFVALHLPRCMDLFVAMLGVLKAGGIYVPIDFEYPAERVDYLIADSGCKVVVNEALLARFRQEQTHYDRSNLTNKPVSSSDAYVIYTSGSTGQPKGVLIGHDALANYVLAFRQVFDITGQDRVIQQSSLSFDTHIEEIFPALISGGAVLVAPDGGRNFYALTELIAQQGATILSTTPLVLQELNRLDFEYANLRAIISGGDVLKAEYIDRIVGKVQIFNTYGPSESTVAATWCEITTLSDNLPIGKPFPGRSMYVLDQNQNPVPMGVAGEISIGGAGLSKGYLNNPALNEAKFVAHPFQSGQRLYKTGDLGYWSSDGNLMFVGRKDEQVKIRGYRIEPGEVENALMKAANVKGCAVLAKKNARSEAFLLAFVVTEDGIMEVDALRAHLSGLLPEYMIPAAWTQLATLPLTTTGKVNKKALAALEVTPQSDREYVAPQSQTEKILAEIWMRLLDLERIGIKDNFFEAGGHSLLAMRVIAAVEKTFRHRLSVKDIFTYPTIEGLAQCIENKPTDISLPPVVALERPERIPLSYAQERLWFVDQLEGSVQYHQPTVLRLTNHLDKAALEAALAALVNRHEVLRTVIQSDHGQPYQEILSPDAWHMAFSEDEAFAQEAFLRDFIDSEITRPFDLSKDYLLRAHLIRRSETDHVLILVVHHIASDGWSESILVKELTAFYGALQSGSAADLLPLPVQYADYAIWQRTHLAGEYLETQLAWWEQQLQELEPLKFPTDFTRPALQSNRGESFSFEIDPQLSDQIKALSLQSGASLFMTLLAAFKVLLYRYTGQEDICVGTPIANRNHHELEPLVGFFINTLVLRDDLKDNPAFSALLGQMKANTLAAFAHQEVPFEKIVDRVEKDRDLSRNPVFQIVFTVENTPEVPELELGGLHLAGEASGYLTSNFDMTFSVRESSSGMMASIVYSTDLFTEDRMARMAEHFRQLLQSIVANPDQPIAHLPILSAAEQQKLVFGFNETAVDYPRHQTIVDLFEAQAARTPDNIAVLFGETKLTYRELNERSNQLGAYLNKKYSIRADDRIGIKLERSEWMILTILGILKSGGAYLPIDVKFPEDRIRFMLEDSGCKVLVDDQELEAFRREASLYATENFRTALTPRDLAYVIYTSGSTGRSKGVQIEHGSLVNEISSLKTKFSISERDRILQTANYVFDPSIEQIFLALLSGATLVLITRETLVDGELMEKVLDEQQITYLHLTPSLLKNITPRAYHSLRQISAGGELCTLELARSWAPYLQFVNKYGPTEATITSTTFHFSLATDSDKTMTLSVGRALGNAKVYILDKYGNLAPTGVFGEICIGGAGVARGYLNRPELTEEKFIPSPFVEGEKIYKTGDLGRWMANGNLEFLARQDDQVKIRGYRVELGEVESVLHRSPVVAKSVVLAKETPHGDRRLVAYVVPQTSDPKGIDKDAIRRFLETQLPDYMIPSAIMELAELPLTVNGKVDKKALPDPELHLLMGSDRVAPRNETESRLAQIWSELLHIESIGVHDNFFEVGGHSLLAMRVISAIRKAFEQEVKVRDIFTHPTIAGLAAHLNAGTGATSLPDLKPGLRPDKIPLSYAQERLWFIDQLEGSVQYHQPTVLRLKNKLNKSALEAAFAGLIERHEVLRTVIRSEEGQPFQEVMPSAYWRMRYSEDVAFADPARLQTLIASEINRPFDLAADYMLRAHLVKCGTEEHVLILVLHHIAADGWSQSLLVNDLAELYSAVREDRLPDLAPLVVQYADYAAWQRKHVSGEYLENQLKWWEGHLQGLTPLNLPLDFQRPATQSTNGASTGFRISKELTEQLKEVSLQSGATLFMTLLSAFNVLLSRYSSQDDICVGMPIANRNQKEVEPMVGFFINTLVLRNDLSGNPTFRNLLQKVKENTLSTLTHQEVPFEQIVERVESERNLSRSPIFQVVFNMQNLPETPDLELSGLNLTFEAPGHDLSRFDLTISVNEGTEGLRIAIAYCSDLFLEETIQRMAGHFQTLLAAVANNPDENIARLDMLTAAEKQQLLYEFSTASVDYPKEKTLVELFGEQVQQTPDRLALVYQGVELTYREFDRQTSQLASYLRERGVVTGSMVAICIDDSLDIVLSIWGILKAGGTYIPLDYANPADRINFIIDHTRAGHVLTNKSCSALVERKDGLQVVVLDEEGSEIAKAATTAPTTKLTPENLLYVIHTSGSTGKPKGVMLSHRNVNDHLHGFFSRVQFRSSRTFAIMSTMSADLANTVLFGALISGGTIHLLAKSVYTDAGKTHAYFRQHSIDFMKLVPSHWRALENEEGILLPNRTIVFGGEVLSIEILEKIKAINPKLEIINHYGPTEVTIGKVCYRVDFNALPFKTPIGKPFCNTHMYVVDKYLSLCPIGVPGELLIGGDGVSKGYINRPEMTAERYIKNPFSNDENDLLYRSGDLIRWLPDGNLDFLDRVDDQVKVRGYRIELGEINIVLKQAPTVSQSVVLARKDSNGQNRLIAYVVPEGKFNKQEVQAYLKSQLPDYMIPSLLIELDRFPLNANGKIDRKSLPDPETVTLGADGYVAPQSETELQLAAIWKQLLNVERVGIHDNFFEVGGHSLLAMRVITAIRKEFALNMPLKVIFSFPTIAELQNYILLIRESVETVDHKESEVIEL